MKLSLFGRLTMALLASMALGLGMTACGGGMIGYMWVLGQQYNQIAGFKIDDYTGNLTTIPSSPFSSGGSVPVSIVVKAGGRYIYVVNQGVGGSQAGNGSGAGVAEYAVGGDGTLTYQATFGTQGFVSQWAQMDSSGTYLYVLDKYHEGPLNSNNVPTANTDGLGGITVFASDPNTGRLSLVTNSQTQNNGVNTLYWLVGQTPFMMKAVGSCLFTVNSYDQTISPYSVGSGGQLVTVATGTQPVSTVYKNTVATSINGSGSYLYITDSANNRIFPYTLGSCNPQPVTGGSVPNVTGAVDPTYSLLDNSGKYLYVLNQNNTNTVTPVPNSNISAFTVNQVTGQLAPIAGSPYTVGSGPVCMVEDTSNQYIYVSNYNDGTVTGKVIDPTTGNLSVLTRGSTFNATGHAGCLVLSGAVS